MQDEISRLTVVYDERCDLCVRARAWLSSQPQYVPLEFVGVRSDAARRIVPGIEIDDLLRDFTVVSDRGEIWRGPSAWVTCLWALRRYRAWSYRWSHPAVAPTARWIINSISSRRLRLSKLLPTTSPKKAKR